MTIRITWTPKTNSQRTAIAKFGTDWELAEFYIPLVVKGHLCRFIRPVGDRMNNDARWIRVEQIQRLV